jgi:glycerate 2-kinase
MSKEIARRIFRETLAAIDIATVLERELARRGSLINAGKHEVDLAKFGEIVVVAFGKAAFPMVRALTDILAPDYVPKGILVAPDAPPVEMPGWEVFVAGHPVPNTESFAAGRAILNRLARSDHRTLIIFLISGGGSSLVDQPLEEGITLEDFQGLHTALVTCGAPIEEINAVRKHLSAVKGGRMAAAAPHSMKLTFAISDVPLGHESAIASGPTLPDPTTIEHVERVVEQYGLLDKFPPAIRRVLENRELRETPKEDHKAFALAHAKVLLGTHELTHAAHRICESLGYVSLCDESTDGWAIDRAADHLLAMLETQKRENPHNKVAIIAGGEVSSPVTGNGFGGRNSAFVLGCVPKIATRKITAFSGGTDGVDGKSPAAGAVADGFTMARAMSKGLDVADFRQRSDSYSFFDRLGDAIVTGPTGINLRDLRILMMD